MGATCFWTRPEQTTTDLFPQRAPVETTLLGPLPRSPASEAQVKEWGVSEGKRARGDIAWDFVFNPLRTAKREREGQRGERER